MEPSSTNSYEQVQRGWMATTLLATSVIGSASAAWQATQKNTSFVETMLDVSIDVLQLTLTNKSKHNSFACACVTFPDKPATCSSPKAGRSNLSAADLSITKPLAPRKKGAHQCHCENRYANQLALVDMRLRNNCNLHPDQHFYNKMCSDFGKVNHRTLNRCSPTFLNICSIQTHECWNNMSERDHKDRNRRWIDKSLLFSRKMSVWIAQASKYVLDDPLEISQGRYTNLNYESCKTQKNAECLNGNSGSFTSSHWDNSSAIFDFKIWKHSIVRIMQKQRRMLSPHYPSSRNLLCWLSTTFCVFLTFLYNKEHMPRCSCYPILTKGNSTLAPQCNRIIIESLRYLIWCDISPQIMASWLSMRSNVSIKSLQGCNGAVMLFVV